MLLWTPLDPWTQYVLCKISTYPIQPVAWTLVGEPAQPSQAASLPTLRVLSLASTSTAMVLTGCAHKVDVSAGLHKQEDLVL